MIRRTVAALAVAMLLGVPPRAGAMTSDGVIITNSVAVTAYWGSGGLAYTSRYSMSYNASAAGLVTNPIAMVQETVTPTTIATGGTLTYTISVINSSQFVSAWNITASDRLSDWVGYVSPSVSTWAPAGSTWYWTHSANNTTWAMANAEPINGQTAPWYLRWIVNPLGPGRSAYVRFKGTVL